MFNFKSNFGYAIASVVLGLSLGLTGCSDSSSSNNPTPASGEIDLGRLSSSEKATVVLGYYPGENDLDTATATLYNTTMGEAKAELPLVKAKETTDDKPVYRCGLPALLENQGPIQAKSRAELTNYTVNTEYTKAAKGDDIGVYAVKNLSSHCAITVRKLLSNDETSSILAFAQVVDGSPVATEEQAKTIDKYFGTSNPYDTDGKSIGERVRGVFGSEWGYEKGDGGLDGTTKIIIVFLDSNTIGSDVYGYFDPSDEVNQSVSTYSNEGEILYLNAAKCSNEVDFYSTVAHEFQHMCNYNQKYVHNGAYDGESAGELTSINEGQSVLAEDLTGFNLTAQKDGSHVPGNSFIYNTATEFLQAPSAAGGLQSWGGSKKCYGQAYLIMRYIYDSNGESMINKIATSTDTGIEHIDKLLNNNFAYTVCDMLTSCLGLSSLPSDWGFKTLKMNESYLIADGSSEGATKTLAALTPDATRVASSFSGCEVEMKANTPTVIEVEGDGSNVSLYFDLPANCVGEIVVSGDDECEDIYDME